jgi:hypothetical protein
MEGKITDIVSIWDGLPRGDVLYLLAGSDRLTEERAPHSMLIEYSGGPRAVATLDWTARDIAADPHHEDGVLLLGLEGEIARFRGGQVESLPPISGEPPPSARGTLLYLGEAGGHLMACGGNQQVYRYSPRGHWIRQEQGLTRPEDGGLSQFEFVVGDSQSGSLYTAGARGEAWYWNGAEWQSLDMPTNVRLTSACRGLEGEWWITGQLGTLIRGSGTSWEAVHQDEEIPFFWDLAFYRGTLFLTTDRVLYQWKDGELEPVNFADDTLYEGLIPYSFYKLSVGGDRLLTFGAKDIMSFDGERWHRIV